MRACCAVALAIGVGQGDPNQGNQAVKHDGKGDWGDVGNLHGGGCDSRVFADVMDLFSNPHAGGDPAQGLENQGISTVGLTLLHKLLCGRAKLYWHLGANCDGR